MRLSYARQRPWIRSGIYISAMFFWHFTNKALLLSHHRPQLAEIQDLEECAMLTKIIVVVVIVVAVVAIAVIVKKKKG